MSKAIEDQARKYNDPKVWNTLWGQEGDETWRQHALADVYDRIVHLMPKGSRVIEFGAGVGILSDRLKQEKGCEVTSVDHSDVAIRACEAKGLRAMKIDLESEEGWGLSSEDTYVVATEVIEHLSDRAMHRILKFASEGKGAFLSIPNDRLGPDEEPQHARKLTAMQYLTLLRTYWGDRCRVECLGAVMDRTKAPEFSMGVCGVEKRLFLTVTLPVRDEADDLPLTLATFRGVADEIVIGVMEGMAA